MGGSKGEFIDLDRLGCIFLRIMFKIIEYQEASLQIGANLHELGGFGGREICIFDNVRTPTSVVSLRIVGFFLRIS